jgi:hypothetical protein
VQTVGLHGLNVSWPLVNKPYVLARSGQFACHTAADCSRTQNRDFLFSETCLQRRPFVFGDLGQGGSSSQRGSHHADCSECQKVSPIELSRIVPLIHIFLPLIEH